MSRVLKMPIALLITLASIIALIFLIVLSSKPQSVTAQDGVSHISFSSDSGLVLLPSDCITVRWQVEGIREVYLNAAPQIGTGEQVVCVNAGTQPTLTVILNDGTKRDYQLPITILFAHPLFWGAVLAMLWALVRLRIAIGQVTGSFVKQMRQLILAYKVVQRLAIVVVSVGITCLLLDVGLRLYFTRFGTREDKIKYVYSLEEIQSQNSNLVPMPYVNYVPSPGYTGHNSLGYRGTEIAIPKPEGVFRIVALGGSTTYSSATTAEEAYPAQLQNILREEYGYINVEVINAGFLFYSSWETLVNFEFRVLELQPDLIILYDSVNDIVPREQLSVDCYRGLNTLRGLNGTKGFWVERDSALSPSTLYRLIAINLGWMQSPLALNSWFQPPQANCQNDALPVEERVAQNPPVYFERNVRNTVILAKANDVIPVISTWTYYRDQERPDYWRKAVDEQNDILKNIALAEDVPLFDLAGNLPIEADFWSGDGIHMFLPGTHEQAAEYARFLTEQNLLTKSS
ncbi:MAG: GDSL-type esterase/lipase family protein [Anaerolineae bacterium]